MPFSDADGCVRSILFGMFVLGEIQDERSTRHAVRDAGWALPESLPAAQQLDGRGLLEACAPAVGRPRHQPRASVRRSERTTLEILAGIGLAYSRG
jgi:hypothetical protein